MDIEEETHAPVDDKERFLMDMEFIQGLSNPEYLRCTDKIFLIPQKLIFSRLVLAQHPNKYLEQPEFISYLKYLLYWKKPEYSKFLA